MKHNREFWARHVKGLARQRTDARAVLSAPPIAEGNVGVLGVDVEQVEARPDRPWWRSDARRSSLKGGALRSSWWWSVATCCGCGPGMEPDHLRDVLSVLEPRS